MAGTTPQKSPARAKMIALPPVENLARIAAAAQTIANAADTLLRAGNANLALSDWALLQRLSAQEGGQIMARIAVQSGVTRQRIQKQLEALAEARYVTVVTVADDKRLRTVALAPLGRDVLKRASSAWTDKLAKSELATKLTNGGDALRQRLDRVAIGLCRVAREEMKVAHAARLSEKGAKGARKA